jgi:hypothetical protein
MHAYIHQLCNTYYVNKYNYKPSSSSTKPNNNQLIDTSCSCNNRIPFIKKIYNHFMKNELNMIPTLATSHTVKYYKLYPLYTHS